MVLTMAEVRHFSRNCMSVNSRACISFEQAKAHVQTYLKNLEENLLDREDRTELYLLFVNCFQVKKHQLYFPLMFSA